MVYFVVEEGMDVNREVCDADTVVDVESIQKNYVSSETGCDKMKKYLQTSLLLRALRVATMSSIGAGSKYGPSLRSKSFLSLVL